MRILQEKSREKYGIFAAIILELKQCIEIIAAVYEINKAIHRLILLYY